MSELSDRMKVYEHKARTFLDPNLPVIVRIDGRSFSTWTARFKKPWDDTITEAMTHATIAVGSEIGNNCRFGYSQSDEISLLLHRSGNTQPWFNYNKAKLESIIASLVTAHFNSFQLSEQLATFDARAFNLPKNEVTNYFIFRQNDWKRNMVSMVGQSKFSQRALNGVKTVDLRARLEAGGFDFNNLDSRIKLGTCYKNQPDIGFWPMDTTPEFVSNKAYIEETLCPEVITESLHV